ncbi:MAG: HAD-IIIA family hydrolase [Christensenellaceae bacterium]
MDNSLNVKALILAGGKGTRLAELTKNLIPKPMVVINGKTILERAVMQLKRYGVTDIFMSVGFLNEKIRDHFGNGEKFGVKIEYIVENEPLGSGGALFFVKDKIKSDLIVCPGDVIFDVNFNKLVEYHRQKNALITLFSHPNIHPYDSDLVMTDNEMRVTEINKKNSERNFFYKNLVNAGIFVLSPETLSFFKELKAVNMEHDFVASFIESGRVFAYKSSEYVKDVGTMDRFSAAEKDLNSGVVAAKNSENKQKAIFLDRDGTINKYKGFITDINDLELLPGVPDAIKKINASGYLAIIVSNQPVIARGECTFDEVNAMFDKIETLLGKSGAYIDGIYYCPHHPHSGYDGEVKELKIKCDCRKPEIGMLKKAEKDFNLDLKKCIMIGDGELDVKTGKNAGIPTVLVKTGIKEELSIAPDYYADNLLSAVNIFIND